MDEEKEKKNTMCSLNRVKGQENKADHAIPM